MGVQDVSVSVEAAVQRRKPTKATDKPPAAAAVMVAEGQEFQGGLKELMLGEVAAAMVGPLTVRQSLEAGLLVPPVNFGMVDDGVYRSGFPERANLGFLGTLNLRSILSLCPEPYLESNMEFLETHGITLFQLGIDGTKEPAANIPEGRIREALELVLAEWDQRRHGLVSCGKKGMEALLAAL